MQILLLYGVMIGLLYFVLIRPQKKKQQKLTGMRDELKTGDKVTTIGGLAGIVKSVKEDDVALDVGSDQVLKFKKWAIGQVENKKEVVNEK